MKKLFAGAGKIAGVAGCSTNDMKDFLTTVESELDVRDEEFINQEGKQIKYKNYEVVMALVFYENYKIAMDTVKQKAAMASAQAQRPITKSQTLPPEIDINEDEIPF